MIPRISGGRRKVHANSVLKNLSPARQHEIYEYLRAHSLVKTAAWLAAAGFHISAASLRIFYHWYLAEAVLRDANADRILQEFLEERPELKPRARELRALAEAGCMAVAIEREDPQLFIALCEMRQARAARRLAEDAPHAASPL